MGDPVRKDFDFGDTLIENYMKVFSGYSFHNESYGKISLHVIIGQALCKNVYYRVGTSKKDIRVHLLLIKPQGTGKGAGYDCVEAMASGVSLNFQSLTESTDAGLVGTTEVDYDTKERIEVPGLLKTADVIGMEEASVIFDLTSEFSKKNMTYFQITMNSIWSKSNEINKRLGGLDIKIKPHASFVFTTYPPDKLVDKILKTGFLDRVIPIFEDVTLVDRLETIRQMARNTNVSTAESYAKERERVVQCLKVVIDKYNKSDICIVIPDNILQLMTNVIDDFAMKIFDASPKARQKLEHFITRFYGNLINLAVHHALLSLRTTLDVSDVGYARYVLLPIWQNLIISIESLLIISPTETSRLHRILRTSIDEYDLQIKLGKFVKEGNWVRRRTMVENLQPKWDNCSWETADTNLRKLEKLPASLATEYEKLTRYEKDKFFEAKPIGDVVYIRKIKEI